MNRDSKVESKIMWHIGITASDRKVNLMGQFTILQDHHLNVTQHSRRVHPTGLIDGVSPDVEHRLGGPNHPADQRTRGNSDPQLEVVERVLVDVLQLVV